MSTLLLLLLHPEIGFLLDPVRMYVCHLSTNSFCPAAKILYELSNVCYSAILSAHAGPQRAHFGVFDGEDYSGRPRRKIGEVGVVGGFDGVGEEWYV